jgi:tetratricopeptide (TPR) repeat protein
VPDEPGNPEPALRKPENGGGVAVPAVPARNWRGLWQVPALLIAGALLTGGIVALLRGAPEPDLDALIGRAESHIDAQQYRTALEELNKNVRPWYDGGSLSPEQMRRFHLLRARAVYMGQKDVGIDLPENARTVADEYRIAARDTPLDNPRDIYFLADAHVTLGLYERALELARTLPVAERERPDPTAGGLARIYRRIIERQVRDPQATGDVALRLLAEFLRDAAANPTDRAWALSRQTQILIRQGSHEAAIARLLRSMPALMPELEPGDLGELHLLLGRAYIETGAIAEAGRQLSAAVQCLLDTDERWARAMILLARVEEATGLPPEDARAEARQKYLSVLARFDGSEERLSALLGLGEVEAALGDYQASLAAYSRLVDSMMDGAAHPEVTGEVVTASVLARWRGLFDLRDIETALGFALLAERLGRHVPGREDTRAAAASPEVLLALARTHRALADQPLAIQASDPREIRSRRIAELDGATRQSIRANLTTAGRYYKMYADAIGVSDNAAFGESLWAAAESFDHAGDLDASIPLFADYVRFFPGDPRRAEARFNLARSYQARGDYALAAEHFRSIIVDGRTLAAPRGTGREGEAQEITGVGPYADLSVVPLAQVLLLDADPANDAEAESLLNEVVAGRIGGATTPQFRDGLIQLGLLMQRRGNHAGAIQRLEEAVTRFPAYSAVESVRFSLAEAHRQDAAAIRRTLAEAMPEHRRHMLEQTRFERLRRAESLYEQVRQALESRDSSRRTRLENVQLRNSYFHLGDCAFELGEYGVAIQRYDAARERFPGEPAALVAMVQIVNAYVELGDLQRALTANERARRFYQTIPQSAWNDTDLPMNQEDWQRWLDSMTVLRPIRSPDSVTAGVEDRER